MKKTILVQALTILFVLFLGACGNSVEQAGEPTAEVPSWQEQYDIGVRYLSEGKYAEAIIAFTAAIEIDPKQAPAYVGRGDAYVLSGETEENLEAAQVDYEQAIAQDASNAEAYLGLADVYIRRGEYDKATEILKRGLDATGGDQSIADKLEEMEGENITDSSGRVRRMNAFDGNGDLIWWHEYKYLDEIGLEQVITSYDVNGNQTGQVTEKYGDNGEPLVSLWYFTDTGIVGRDEYEYDEQGNEIRIVTYEPSGEMSSYSTKEYSAEGYLLRENAYSPNGELWNYTLYEYNPQGREVKRSYYHAENDELDHYYLTEYDNNGKRRKESSYNKDGTLTGYSIYIFDERGKTVGRERYDGDGNLVQTTTYE